MAGPKSEFHFSLVTWLSFREKSEPEGIHVEMLTPHASNTMEE